MIDHHRHRTAERIAAVPWLAASRRAHENWPLRLALLTTGCAVMAAPLGRGLGLGALVVVVSLGVATAAVGLTMGASYGRVVAGLAAALEVGYTAHWLAGRLERHEDDPTSLALELEQLSERQPAR